VSPQLEIPGGCWLAGPEFRLALHGDSTVMNRVALILGVLLALPAGQALSLDEKSAKAADDLLRKSGCYKCHAPERKKDGPSLKSIADKWRGKPDAMSKLSVHVTTNPIVKIEGKEEQHEMLKLKSDSPEEVKNAVTFILDR
jgi:cytochrome c